jgi:NAD+ synthase (glutamine-hydrolysing)
MSKFIVVMAQVNPLVGDIPGNTQLVIDTVKQAIAQESADIVMFPELTLTGYPPEDLLLRASLDTRIDQALVQLMAAQLGMLVVVGYPRRIDGKLYNMAAAIYDGKMLIEYAKQCLPNYQVFDEKRYFTEGSASANNSGVFEYKNCRIGLSLCEDIWHPEPIARATVAGAQLLLSLNASPFHVGKTGEREQVLQRRAQESGIPILYVNQVGGQDELVFDGGSMAIAADGHLHARAPQFETANTAVEIVLADAAVEITAGSTAVELSQQASVYQALVMGVRDYVNKNGFKGTILGLSGGIDSALTLAVAVDALGADRVEAVMMPFHYTSELSKNDAQDEAERLGVRYQSMNIESMYEAFMASLADEFAGTQMDTTEQNLQARCRGVLLMAISNKKGSLVLTTGNKSELAVGYSTLYGDMAGGFDVLKDVPKTMVFDLCLYRNSVSEVIPRSVIARPPSAELAPDQKDEDNLPPYDVLDPILERYIERDWSAEAIIADGFERPDVERVLRLVDINEHKRRQAPIGVRISQRGFGRDRRYPITSGWKLGE